MHGLSRHLYHHSFLRRTLVGLLLACVSVGVAGEWLVFKAVQWDIHEEIENRIRYSDFEEGLVVIKISNQQPPDDLIWTERHEFRYRGQMYDIVKHEVRNDTTYYTCIHDVRESKLYADVEQQIQDDFSQNPERRQQHTDLLNKIPKFYCINISFILFNFVNNTPKPNVKLLTWAEVPPAIPSPPPKCL
jgi:hypothetical protein